MSSTTLVETNQIHQLGPGELESFLGDAEAYDILSNERSLAEHVRAACNENDKIVALGSEHSIAIGAAVVRGFGASASAEIIGVSGREPEVKAMFAALVWQLVIGREGVELDPKVVGLAITETAEQLGFRKAPPRETRRYATEADFRPHSDTAQGLIELAGFKFVPEPSRALPITLVEPRANSRTAA